MDKKTIGVITFFRRNYGAFLQAYALQKALEKTGFSPELINYDYYHDNTFFEVPKILFKKNKKEFIKRVLSNIKNYSSQKKSNKVFDNSVEKNLKVGKRIKSYKDLKKSPPQYDAYLSGSDQVFNPNLNPQGWESRLLSFTEGRKFTYAASCGSSNIENSNYLSSFKNEIVKFSLLSFREKSFFDNISREISDLKGEVNIDPVFLLSRDEWSTFSNDKIHDQKYIFVYFVAEKGATINRALELSKETGLPLLFSKKMKIKGNVIKTKGIMSPEEWIGAIKNAEYVVTNSFHGTSLSIIFQKKLVIVEPKKNPERIRNLITNCNIEKLMKPFDPINYKYSFIDCEKYIQKEKTKSYDYLKRVLEICDE